MSHSRDFARSIVETIRNPLLVLDTELRVRTANQAFYQFFQASPGSTEGQLLYQVEGGQWDAVRHGHQSYLALGWIADELGRAGVAVIDAVPQPVYGGALRVFATVGGTTGSRVSEIRARERALEADHRSP